MACKNREAYKTMRDVMYEIMKHEYITNNNILTEDSFIELAKSTKKEMRIYGSVWYADLYGAVYNLFSLRKNYIDSKR